MDREKVFSIINTILEQSGYNEAVTISTTPYECANFHIINGCQLGFSGKDLFYFSSIKQIQYYFEEKNSNLKIIFELSGRHLFIYERGHQEKVSIHSNEGNYMEYPSEEFDKFISLYNLEEKMCYDICFNLETLDFNRDDYDLRSAKIWYQEGLEYIKKYKRNINEIMAAIIKATLDYTYMGIEQDVFELKDLIDKLEEENRLYSVIWLFEEKNTSIMSEEEIADYINIIMETKQL